MLKTCCWGPQATLRRFRSSATDSLSRKHRVAESLCHQSYAKSEIRKNVQHQNENHLNAEGGHPHHPTQTQMQRQKQTQCTKSMPAREQLKDGGRGDNFSLFFQPNILKERDGSLAQIPFQIFLLPFCIPFSFHSPFPFTFTLLFPFPFLLADEGDKKPPGIGTDLVNMSRATNQFASCWWSEFVKKENV